MASKAAAIKFDKTNKSSMKGRVGHSRTGACPRRVGNKCQCQKRDR